MLVLRSVLRPWFIITLLCLVYCLSVIAAEGSPLALVTLGTRFSDGNPADETGTEGYDGQFVYYIARDPSNAAPFLDVPAYRFQRILLPALAIPLSLGQETLIPWALLAINLTALAAGTAIMEQLLVQHRVSRWYALVYALSVGAFGAVRLSLTEPLAYALAIAGIWWTIKDRPLLGATLFALAALAKETTLIIAGGCGLYLLTQRRWRDAILFGGIALLPFIGWQFVLYNRLGEFGVGSGGALATSFELIPFMGVIRIITEGALVVLNTSGIGPFIAFMLIYGLAVGVFVLVPTLWGLLRSWHDLRTRETSLTMWLLLATSLIMLFVPFSTYREPVGILRFIVGLQITVLLYAAQHHQRRILLYSTIWMLSVFFVLSLRPA